MYQLGHRRVLFLHQPSSLPLCVCGALVVVATHLAGQVSPLENGPADSRRFSEVTFGIQRGKPENVQTGCLSISIVFGFCSLLAFQKTRSDLGILEAD